MKRDLTVSFVKVNLIGVLFLMPVTLLGIAYLSIWDVKFDLVSLILSINLSAAALFLAAIVAGIFVHELIHLASAMYFGKISSRDFSFSLDLKTLTPYFHCKVPLEVGIYRKLTAMPGILLGLLPSIVGLIGGNP